jgi:hypothetical protein
MVTMEYEYSQVRRIRRLDANTYEVVVGNTVDREEVLICTVDRAKGAITVTDISSTHDPRAVFDGRVDTRQVTAELVAYAAAE